MYKEGIGTEKNIEKSEYWLSRLRNRQELVSKTFLY